jgi:hypothetical protein
VNLAQAKIDLEDRIEERDKKDYRRVSDATLDGIRADYILAEKALRMQKNILRRFVIAQRMILTGRRHSALYPRTQEPRRALYNLNYALGKPDIDEVSKAEALVELAKARLNDAEKEYQNGKTDQIQSRCGSQRRGWRTARNNCSAEDVLSQQSLKAHFPGRSAKST